MTRLRLDIERERLMRLTRGDIRRLMSPRVEPCEHVRRWLVVHGFVCQDCAQLLSRRDLAAIIEDIARKLQPRAQ